MIASSTFGQMLIPVLAATIAWIAISFLAVLRSKNQTAERIPRGWFSRAAYAVFLAATLLLAVTSIGSIIRVGHMQHLALQAHLAAAGVFTFSMLIVAIVYLPMRWPLERYWWMERWSALLLITFALITAGSMFLGMMPLLDTEGLEFATVIHRYSGLGTVSLAAVHLYSVVVRWLGYR
jgi:hypothetical protein